ncbi:MAG: hypothetical protein ACLFVQ_03200 [Chitinispirillaceae bacterium]
MPNATFRHLLFTSTLLVFSSISLSASADESDEIRFYRSRYLVALQGEQEGSYPKNRFVVTGDVYIREGTTMKLSPGTTVFFKANTRIIVEGKLLVSGNDNQPVEFRKLEPDQYFSQPPENQDNRWDGLFVYETGSVEIKHAEINGSKYGLEAVPGAGDIRILESSFQDNRYWNLKVNGEIVDKGNHAVLNYPGETRENNDKPDVVITPPEKSSGKNFLRYSAVAFTVAGLGAGIFGLVQNLHHYDLYDRKRPGSGATTEEVDRHQKLLEDGRNIAIAGFSAGALGLTGFALTFTF